MGRLIIDTHKTEEMAEVYRVDFGFRVIRTEGDRLVELRPDGGATNLLHPASKGKKPGQALVKLVFDVADVPAFCRGAWERGLSFGPIHQAGGQFFAKATDRSNTSIPVSSRGFST